MEWGGVILEPECSNLCLFCGKFPKVDSKELERQELNVKKNLEEFKGRGIENVEISGGDPIEYPKIIDLMNDIKAMGFKEIRLSTHGRKLSDQNFLQEFIKSGCTQVKIPIYGHTAEIHDAVVRSKGSFEETITGIKALVEQSSMLVHAGTLIMQQNKGHLIELLDFIKELGIKDFSISIPCVADGNFSYYVPTKDLPPYVRKLQQYAKALKFDIHFMEIPDCVFGRPTPETDNRCRPPDLGDHCQPPQVYRTNVKSLPSYRVKGYTSICAVCKCKNFCNGFFVNDIEKFGIGNLKPIF
ncbi:MAG: radical SAM protein [Candidatus Nanoarchaeia archaeon]